MPSWQLVSAASEVQLVQPLQMAQVEEFQALML